MPWASADGLYIVWLLLELTQRGLDSHLDRVREGLDTIDLVSRPFWHTDGRAPARMAR